MRPLVIALAAFALTAPEANAAVADRYVPFYDADDGVTVGEASEGKRFIRFGRKAAKIYAKVAGRHARVACGSTIERPDGRTPVSGGYAGSDYRLPRKRGRVYVLDTGGEIDLCTIATRRTRADAGRCLPNAAGERLCVRVVVAFNDLARAYVDARSRAIEVFRVRSELPFARDNGIDPPLPVLRRLVGKDIVLLPTWDALPPAGQVGVWISGEDYAIVARLRDGRPQFARELDGVYSTNVYELIRGEDPEHTTFSLFL